MMIEIRCCCDAHLIGWIDIPFPTIELGRVYKFSLKGGGELAFECAGLSPDYRPALKSRDFPIEDIRRIPGFLELPPFVVVDIMVVSYGPS